MEQKYNIGDVIWSSGLESAEEDIPCPICLGEKEITVIFPNGEEWAVPCEECQSGFAPPRGFITVRYYNQVVAIPYVVQEIKLTREGYEYGCKRYWAEGGYTHWTVKEKDVFDTEEEAIEDGFRKAEERADKDQASLSQKQHKAKSYAHDATWARKKIAEEYRSWCYYNERFKALNKKAEQYKNLYTPEDD